MELTVTLIVAALVIVICVISNKITLKIGVPMLFAFILLGMIFGSDGLFRIEFADFAFAEQICTVALIFIMFYGGFGTNWHAARKTAPCALLLSTVGVVITAVLTGLFCFCQCGSHDLALSRINADFLHQQLQLADGFFHILALFLIAEGFIIPADNLLTGSIAGGLIVDDTVTHHINTHVRRGLVGTLAQDLLEDGDQNGIGFYVTVIVNSGNTVGIQVEGVDHVHIVQISGSGFIGQVHRMIDGQIPDGKGLKLGIAGSDAALMLVVQLA